MTRIDPGDRPERLHVLDFGLFEVHENGRHVGICGFLVTTKSGGHVLIDSGFPAKYVEDLEAAAVEDRLGEFGRLVRFGPENLVAAQLDKLGLRPNDIDLFVLTHSHIDHVGGLHDFPDATLVVGAAERALPRPLYWGEVQPLEWPGGERIEIAADFDLFEGFTLLATPGHTQGHLSALVELPETGPVLLTADAISRPSEFEEGFGGWDGEMARASADRLMALARERDAFVIFGHDPAQWPELKKAPQYYG